jgi:dCTP deaminase
MITTPSVLSDIDILQEIENENIVISPFKRQRLSNCSYDVTLGSWYFEPNKVTDQVIDPWNEKDVCLLWGEPKKACTSKEPKKGYSASQEFIIINPGITILAHTNEIIGGRGNITTMMKTRSSLGRIGIGVCKCAGWGDIGYINHWTMEITNFNDTAPILLPVGFRIAQIIFMYTGLPSKEYDGKYQNGAPKNKRSGNDVIKYINTTWSPYDMLPKLNRDREIVEK